MGDLLQLAASIAALALRTAGLCAVMVAEHIEPSADPEPKGEDSPPPDPADVGDYGVVIGDDSRRMVEEAMQPRPKSPPTEPEPPLAGSREARTAGRV